MSLYMCDCACLCIYISLSLSLSKYICIYYIHTLITLLLSSLPLLFPGEIQFTEEKQNLLVEKLNK